MKREERAAIRRLIEVFGAEVLITVPDYVVLDRLVRGKLRVAIEEQIAGCMACGLVHTCNAPVPPRWPAGGLLARAQVTVIMESPTEDDDKKAEAASGRVGRIIRSGLQQSGIDPDDCVYGYVNSCRAHDEGIPRPPTAREQAFCHNNLMSTIAAADSQYVILFGATAVRAWRDDVKLSDVAGKLFVWYGRYVWPMWSPQAVLRDTFPQQLWRQQLAQFAQVVADDAGVDALWNKCIDCSMPMYGYDTDGLPWCRVHLPDHVVKAAGRTTREGKHQIDQLTLGST